MEILKVKVVGESALMMHSDKLADPLRAESKAHKELTGKRKKTDEDHIAIAKSEFMAGLYYSEKTGVYVPGANFDATFKAGAKLQKLGVIWTRGALVLTERMRLIYDGPKTPEALWTDEPFRDVRGVRVGTAKIMRYRPVFQEWAGELEISINTDVLNISEAKKILSDAGKLIGVCEYRPRYGRFSVTVA